MKSKLMTYTAVAFLLLGIFTFMMEQVIDIGRFHHAKEDYLLEASLLAYNPLLKQQDEATKQKLSLLNTVQFYDFLARSHQVNESSYWGNTLGSISDQLVTTPQDQKLQRETIKKVAPCHLLNSKAAGHIPEAQQTFTDYQQQFNNELKLTLTEKQLATIWQSLECKIPLAN